MNYYYILIFFTSFFLEIFNSHAVLIECYIDYIDNFNETNNLVKNEKFCELNIPSDNINDGKINLNDLKNNINKYLTKNFISDITNNIENYIVTEAYHNKPYDIKYLNFENGYIIIPNDILNDLKNNSTDSITISFISEDNFEKLKSIKISEIVSLVEGVENLGAMGYTIDLTNLQEGFYKENWNYSIFNYVFHNFQKTIEEWEGELKMKFLNNGSDFRILQNGNPVNILQCLKNNNLDNLTLELQFAYQFMFDVEYKSKNKDFEIRNDFAEEDFKNGNGNEYKTLKHSNEVGEECIFYKNLVIIIKKKKDFKETIKEKFKSEDSYRDLDFKINDTFDIDSVNPEDLLGKKNKLTVICSEFSEYVKSYVVNLNFAVDNKPAGVYISEFSVCKKLGDLIFKNLAFPKKEDITAENIKKKLKIVDKNLIKDKILMNSGVYGDKKKIKFDQNKFSDGIDIYLNINKKYALENNIIIKKETDTVSSNNYDAKVQIFKDDKLPNSPKNNTKIIPKSSTKHISNYPPNLTTPNCCCVNCCSKCCK